MQRCTDRERVRKGERERGSESASARAKANAYLMHEIVFAVVFVVCYPQ